MATKDIGARFDELLYEVFEKLFDEFTPEQIEELDIDVDLQDHLDDVKADQEPVIPDEG